MAALGAVGDGATPRDIEHYFAAAGSQLRPGTAEELLASLAQLGLVRMARGGGHGRRFVPTSIGQRRLQDCLLGGRTEAARLAELETLRTDLLSTIAHELRTPLTALRTSVSLLQDTQHEPDADQRRTLLDTIERNAARMQRLVGDILELARFRSGTVELQLRRFDACQLAAAASASILPLVEAAGQRLALETRSTRIWVYGDHRRLEQALINLLSNAQKFSPAGAGLELRVERQGDEVHWSVADEGPGIEPADRSRLFERFFVGRDDRSGRSSGVGLGLPTTLAIAQAHGGRVEVHSRPGEGSTFVLVVPVRGPEQENEA
jgi:signal transduction histidine kinase